MLHTAAVLFSNLFSVWAPFLIPFIAVSIVIVIIRSLKECK